MIVRAFIAAFLLFAAAPAQAVTLGWESVKATGATGNGSTDDTAAIQAAIDYAFNNGYTGVYCPAGTYKITNTLWLDPPATRGGPSWPGPGMRAQTWAGTGYFAAGAFTVSTTTSGSLEVGDYINGTSQAGVQPVLITGGSSPNWTVNASFTQGSSGSPVAGLTGFDPPNPTTFSFSESFFGDPAAGGNSQGCLIRPTFNNATAFMVGTGQGMRVSDIAVTSSASGYRGNLPASGVGIGLSAGNGGSSGNLIENTYVANFYALYRTAANGGCCLSDSNTWRKIRGDNGLYGVSIAGIESYIDNIYAPDLSATTGVNSTVSKAVNVYGGNLSAGAQSSSFSISSVSAFSKAADGNGFDYSFTATVASPDSNIPNVYNSYTVSTTHFGVIPLTITAWNSATSVGTFQLRPQWVFENYGTIDLTTGTDMQAEVAAATTLYAAERLTVASGEGISLDGVHVEDPNTCSTLLTVTASFAGSLSNTIKNPFFDYDPSNPNSGGWLPTLYCQRTFPFIQQAEGGAIVLDGGTYGQSSLPVLVENTVQSGSGITGSSLQGFRPNFGFGDSGGFAYSQKGGEGQFESEARGLGKWDNFYAAPAGLTGTSAPLWLHGGFLGNFCGFEPCPSLTPNISDEAAGFASVCPSASLSGSTYTCSALGSLGSYPPVPCRTFFALVDWNTGSLPNSRVRSASCPGWSWGQNLTNATTGGTVTWAYKGQSDVLYIDSKSMTFMFPGLNIILPDPTSGNDNYIVTGVFADLGYVTVIAANSNNGAPLAGTKTTVYSCSSSCTIGQNAFAWSAYQ